MGLLAGTRKGGRSKPRETHRSKASCQHPLSDPLILWIGVDLVKVERKRRSRTENQTVTTRGPDGEREDWKPLGPLEMRTWSKPLSSEKSTWSDATQHQHWKNTLLALLNLLYWDWLVRKFLSCQNVVNLSVDSRRHARYCGVVTWSTPEKLLSEIESDLETDWVDENGPGSFFTFPKQTKGEGSARENPPLSTDRARWVTTEGQCHLSSEFCREENHLSPPSVARSSPLNPATVARCSRWAANAFPCILLTV